MVFGSKKKMDSQGNRTPHVLAIPFMWAGHISPLLQLCKYLVSTGIHVTFLNPPQPSNNTSDGTKGYEETWDGGVRVVSGLPMKPQKLVPGVRDKDYNKELDTVAESFEEFQRLFEKEDLMQMIDELSESSGSRLSCVLSDVYVQWAPDVARTLGVEWIAFWTSTVAELVIYFHMPRLISENVFPFAGDASEKPYKLPGLPELRPVHYPHFGFIPPSALHRILHKFKDLVQRIPNASKVLVNSVHELESDPITALRESGVNIHAVGPLQMVTSNLLQRGDGNCTKEEHRKDRVLEWLDTKRQSSVLYIAFGTTMPVAEGQFEELAFALEESGQSFIWAIRETTAALLPEGFSQRMESTNQGLVVYWAPQTAVLQHPAVGGFFTHCGWNSVLEALANGMPMITRPSSGDQVLTRKYLVEEWGVALGLKGGVTGFDVADREDAKRVIKALMEGEEGQTARRKALQMKDVVIKAVGEKGSSWNGLELLIQDLHASV